MLRNITYITVAPLIAACSSGSGVTEIIAQDEDDTVQAALVAGQTVEAKPSLMNAVVLDWETGTITQVDPRRFGVKLPDGDDEDVTLILGGEEVTFTASERRLQEDGVTYYGWSQDADRPRYSLWSWNGTGRESVSVEGASFVNVWEVFLAEEGDTNYRAWTVSGTETAASVLPTLGSATYSGRMRIKAYEQGNDDAFGRENRLNGDVAMSADFGAGTISGLMNDLHYGPNDSDNGDRVPINGSIIMETASIDGEGQYSGDLTPSASLSAGVVTGTGSTLTASTGAYSGDFFGPAANQTAGVISMDLAEDGNARVGSGFFYTNRDD